jgi:hypothetical protein
MKKLMYFLLIFIIACQSFPKQNLKTDNKKDTIFLSINKARGIFWVQEPLKGIKKTMVFKILNDSVIRYYFGLTDYCWEKDYKWDKYYDLYRVKNNTLILIGNLIPDERNNNLYKKSLFKTKDEKLSFRIYIESDNDTVFETRDENYFPIWYYTISKYKYAIPN